MYEIRYTICDVRKRSLSLFSGYEGQFLLPRPTLDLDFTFESLRSSLIRFFIDKLNRKAYSGASAALLAVMLGYSTRDVGSDAGVKNTISAP